MFAACGQGLPPRRQTGMSKLWKAHLSIPQFATTGPKHPTHHPEAQNRKVAPA